MTRLIRNNPVASYFLLAFAISWGGIVAVVFPGAIPAPASETERLFGLVYLAMLAGPVAAALVVTATAGGTALRDFRRRLFNWRASPRWYAVALLTAPVLLGAAALVAQWWAPQFAPGLLGADAAGPLAAASRAEFVLLAIAVGVGAGVFEEVGWTGVATPRLRARHGMFATGIAIGVLWGAWHFLAVYWGSGDAFGDASVLAFMLASLFTFLPPYRVMMTWVFDRTGSLPVAIVMHTSLTTSSLLLSPAVTGHDAILWNVTTGAVLWIIVGAAALLGGRRHTAVPSTA